MILTLLFIKSAVKMSDIFSDNMSDCTIGQLGKGFAYYK